MKAALRKRFGKPAEVVEIAELDRSVPSEDEVLVRIRAASVNAADWYEVTGLPLVARPMQGIRGPKSDRIGTDYAGVVEAVGDNVTDFSVGDEVFGGRSGAFAEYVVARADRAIVPKPPNISFEEAAAVPIAAITALQAVRDKGKLEPGQKVLVHGASGGVGTYTVQIAKALGGEVTAVCSTQNVETARSLGADRVIDYTQEDCSRSGERYDLVLNVNGKRSISAYKRLLAPGGRLVLIGGPKGRAVLGPLAILLRLWVGGLFRGVRPVFFIAQLDKASMQALRELLGSGQVRSVVERTYALDEVAAALDHLGAGHARGKIVVTI